MDPDYEAVSSDMLRKQPLKHELEIQKERSDTERAKCIIRAEFDKEIQSFENDIYTLDQGLNESRLLLDRLRAAALISYYDKTDTKNTRVNSSGIHPAVKTEIGKSLPKRHELNVKDEHINSESDDTRNPKCSITTEKYVTKNAVSDQSDVLLTTDHLKGKHRIIVGNVSKYLPIEQRQHSDQSTHKWMVYVRGPREKPDISHLVEKVWFFLHPTYRPNDLVEINEPPFHLTRRGWGEFPVRVKLLLKDSKNKKIDIIHHLKLDRTYTGLQNLGAETHADVDFDSTTASSDRENLSIKNENHYVIPTTQSAKPLPVCSANELPKDMLQKDRTDSTLSEHLKSANDKSKSALKRKSSRVVYDDQSETITINSQPAARKIKLAQKPPNSNPIPVQQSVQYAKDSKNSHGTPIRMKSLLKVNQANNGVGVSLNTNSPKLSHSSNIPGYTSQKNQPGMSHQPGVYVKLKLNDGRIMLVNKNVIDKFVVKPSVGKSTSNPVPKMSLQPKAAANNPDVATSESKQSQTEGLPAGKRETFSLPEAHLLPDIHCLLTHLVKMHPLLATSKPHSTPTLPERSDFMSWPLGKRRALEWQRAKSIQRHLVDLMMSNEFQYLQRTQYSTKEILIWCRMHLYTPVNHGEVYHNLSTIRLCNGARKQLTAGKLVCELSQLSVNPSGSTPDECGVIDVISVSKSDGISRVSEKKLHSNGLAISPLGEKKYIADLASQVDVKLDPCFDDLTGLPSHATATLLHKLYLKFMEDLIRESHARKYAAESESSGGDEELKVHHVISAIQSQEPFMFLNDLFADVEDSNA